MTTKLIPPPSDVASIPRRVIRRIRALLEASTTADLFAAIPSEPRAAAMRWLAGDVMADRAEWRALQVIERAASKAGIDPKGERARKRRAESDYDENGKPKWMSLPGFCDEDHCPDLPMKKKPVAMPVGVASLDAARKRRDARLVVISGNDGPRRKRA